MSRTRNSIYLVLINTNQSYRSDDPLYDKFKRCVSDMFSEDHLFDFVRFKTGSLDENLSLIDHIDVTIGFEISGDRANTNKIHSHVFIAFRKHKTNLSLDYGKIRSHVKDQCELPGSPYVECRLLRSLQTYEEMKQSVLDYVSKSHNSDKVETTITT